MNLRELERKDYELAQKIFDAVSIWENVHNIGGFVAVDDKDNAIGYGCYADCDNKPHGVSILWVSEEYRRTGLGTSITKHFFPRTPLNKKIWIGAYNGNEEIDNHFDELFRFHGLEEENGELFYTRSE